LGLLASLKFAKSIFKVGKRTFCLPDLGIIAPQDIWIGSRLAEQPRSIQDLALGLDALVDILYFLVEFVGLRKHNERNQSTLLSKHTPSQSISAIQLPSGWGSTLFVVSIDNGVTRLNVGKMRLWSNK